MIIAEPLSANLSPMYSEACRVGNFIKTTWVATLGTPHSGVGLGCVVMKEREAKNIERFNKNLRKLEEIAGFRGNWNGYGAQPLEQDLIIKARGLISELKVQPEIFPTADDSIQIEWEKPNGEYLEIQIKLDNELPAFYVNAKNHELETTVPDKSANINQLVDKFYANTL